MTEDSQPLGGLPPADRTILAEPPLELALAEIRFSAGALPLTPEVGIQLQEYLAGHGHRFARVEPVQQQRINLTAQAGVPLSTQVIDGPTGWLLVSSDGASQVTLTPDAVVYQTSEYHRWSTSMRPILETILAAVTELLEPVFVSRIGLRYVDRFVDSEASTPSAWHGKVAERFLGPACDDRVGHHVKGAQQQVELQLGDAQGALLRHGPFVDPAAGGSVSYLLDIDVYDAEPARFDALAIADRAEVLNRTAASLFQIVIEPTYLRSLQETQSARKQEVAVS